MSFRDEVKKLAHKHPELRPHLVPLLREAKNPLWADYLDTAEMYEAHGEEEGLQAGFIKMNAVMVSLNEFLASLRIRGLQKDWVYTEAEEVFKKAKGAQQELERLSRNKGQEFKSLRAVGFRFEESLKKLQ